MEYQLDVQHLPYLRQLHTQPQTREETQELRIGDGLGNIGRVLCAWGQVVLRGKQWQPDGVGVQGGVMVWVLYAPEDGGPAQCVEDWIPLSVKWPAEQSEGDGKLFTTWLLRGVDARTVDLRRLMVRVTVDVYAACFVPDRLPVYSPKELPKDILLLEKKKPLCLVQEVGEKAFVLDEELTLPSSAPSPEKLVRYSLETEISDCKIIGDKAVFRGKGLLHILYRTAEGGMQSWDFEIPFSQYTELDDHYSDDSGLWVQAMVTALEVEVAAERIRLKAGLAGQYILTADKEYPIVEDAYSPDRTLQMQREKVQVRNLVSFQSVPMRADETGRFGSNRVADLSLNIGLPEKRRNSDGAELEIPCQFSALYYDTEGLLQSATTKFSGTHGVDADSMEAWTQLDGTLQAIAGMDSTIMRGGYSLQIGHTEDVELMPVSALTADEPREKDPARPSLILRKAGNSSLWDIAKQCGATVKAIQEANDLQGEPDPDRVLLIPVL